MLCDTGIVGWPVLYTNELWCKATGVDEDSWLDTCFWSAFKSDRRAQACNAAAVCASFSVAVAGGWRALCALHHTC